MEYYIESDGTVRSAREVENEVKANRRVEQEPESEMSRDIISEGISIPGSKLVKCPYCNSVMRQGTYYHHDCPKK